MALAAAVIGPKGEWLGWQRYLLQAWRRGRRASLLVAAPYERLLPEPLEKVRALLGIVPAEEAHPGGIVVSTPDERIAAQQGPRASPLRRGLGRTRELTRQDRRSR